MDAGLSGTDDNRPELQRMLTLATSGDKPFDVILVHSFSRFARDQIALELNIRRLQKHGVEFVSVSQPLGASPQDVMLRRILGAYDQYFSEENAKHVRRTMLENSRQGFWNGSSAPFGYVIVAAEQRGSKTKKRLAVDPVEAEVVRLMFRLVAEGDGNTGPLGVKAATSFLNEGGYRTRGGARWGVGQLHKRLTSTTYKGEHRYNCTDSKTRLARPENEHVIVVVPSIIESELFDKVQAALKARNPKTTPPRVVSGPILLTGLATCASCGGGMMLRTGKSGRYRYYTCATCAVKGKGACKGRSVPMDKLDDAVTGKLADTLFTTDRVRTILTGLLERQASRSTDHAQRMSQLQNKVADAQGKLSRMYAAIESGLVDLGDDTLKGRVAALKTDRDNAKAALERAYAELRPEARISEENIDAFARLMRENVTQGPIPFRRAYLRSIVDEVEVDDNEIRIHGRRDVLERLVMSGAAAAGVPSFVRKWRACRDSNHFGIVRSWQKW